MPAFTPFVQYFATGSDTAPCQDYEEYEIVECLSEEIQIIDLFKHCKLQPHTYVISDEWAREEDRNKYFDGTRYNRAWVLGRVHHG